QRERGAKLVEIVLVRKLRRLVEPFRHEQFGGDALAFAAVCETDPRPHKDLRRFGQRHDAEAERQPEPDRTLEESRLDQPQPRRIGGAHGFSQRMKRVMARCTGGNASTITSAVVIQSTALIGRVKNGVRSPSDRTRARRKFLSRMSPRIMPSTS